MRVQRCADECLLATCALSLWQEHLTTQALKNCSKVTEAEKTPQLGWQNILPHFLLAQTLPRITVWINHLSQCLVVTSKAGLLRLKWSTGLFCLKLSGGSQKGVGDGKKQATLRNHLREGKNPGDIWNQKHTLCCANQPTCQFSVHLQGIGVWLSGSAQVLPVLILPLSSQAEREASTPTSSIPISTPNHSRGRGGVDGCPLPAAEAAWAPAATAASWVLCSHLSSAHQKRATNMRWYLGIGQKLTNLLFVQSNLFNIIVWQPKI